MHSDCRGTPCDAWRGHFQRKGGLYLPARFYAGFPVDLTSAWLTRSHPAARRGMRVRSQPALLLRRSPPRRPGRPAAWSGARRAAGCLRSCGQLQPSPVWGGGQPGFAQVRCPPPPPHGDTGRRGAWPSEPALLPSGLSRQCLRFRSRPSPRGEASASPTPCLLSSCFVSKNTFTGARHTLTISLPYFKDTCNKAQT